MEKSSLFKLLGWPDPFGVVLLSFFLILLLAPYFSGADFGLFKIPIFTEAAKKWLKIIGPIVFILCALSFIPIFPISKSIEEKQPRVEGTSPPPGPDYSKHELIADAQVLHPLLRERANQLLERAKAEGINVFYFETYRPPKEQQKLFMIGRRERWSTNEGEPKESTVTKEDAWESPFQYGLAVKLLPYGGGQWNESPDQATKQRLSHLASGIGLVTRPSWQHPTFMLPDTKIEDLQSGRYPAGGDRFWADNLNGYITSWGSQEPKAPRKVDLQ